MSEIVSIGPKTFLRLGFRRYNDKAKPGIGRLEIGAKAVTSSIAKVVFGPVETKVDLNEAQVRNLRDRLTLYLDRENGHHHDGVPAEEV